MLLVVRKHGTLSHLSFASPFQAILGKIVSRPSILDKELVQELVNASRPEDEFQVVSGKTMCTQDFYEGKTMRHKTGKPRMA